MARLDFKHNEVEVTADSIQVKVASRQLKLQDGSLRGVDLGVCVRMAVEAMSVNGIYKRMENVECVCTLVRAHVCLNLLSGHSISDITGIVGTGIIAYI